MTNFYTKTKTTEEKNTSVKSANVFKIVVKSNCAKKNTPKVVEGSKLTNIIDCLHPDHSEEGNKKIPSEMKVKLENLENITNEELANSKLLIY